MNPRRSSLLLLLAIPGTLGFALLADELTFHPEKDATSQKKLTIEAEFNVEDASFTMNGEPMPDEALDEIKAQALIVNLAMGVTETFKSTKDGRPLDLLRRYDDLSVSVEFGDESEDLAEAKAFEDKTVRFRWNEEEKAYDKSFHESSGDESALADLIDDMEIRVLLPGKKVAVGDTWEIPANDIGALFFPGGVPMTDDGSGEGVEFQDVTDAIGKQIEDSLKDFKVLCTYKGTREVGGVRVGEVAFTYDGNCRIDLEPLLRKIEEEQGGSDDAELSFTASAGMELKGEGSLLWDLKAGVLHSYSMQAKPHFDVSIEASVSAGNQQFELSMSGAIGGNVAWEMSRGQ